MTLELKELYSSANGDVWSLVRDNDSGRVFVRHHANLASGGATTDTDVSEFLKRTAHGAPEYQAVLRAAASWAGSPPQ